MAFAWDIFAEEIGKTGERLAAGVGKRAADERLEDRLGNLARLRKTLDFDALKQEMEYKSGFDSLQFGISQDLQGMEPEVAERIQGAVVRARQGYDVSPEEFTGLSDLNQAKIGDLLRTNMLKNIDIKIQQDKVQLELDQLEAYKARTGMTEKTKGEAAAEKAEKEEIKMIEAEEKKMHDKSATLLKSAKARLEKERSNLATKAKPSQAEAIGGVLPAQKIAFAKELENVENALDFVSNAESYIAGGLPLRESQESVIKALAGDIKKLRSGKTLLTYKAKMQKRGEEAYEDKYGFFVGEERLDMAGVLQRYVGNDRWVPVK